MTGKSHLDTMPHAEKIKSLENQYAFTTNKDIFLMRLLNTTGDFSNRFRADEYTSLYNAYQKVSKH